ncbi:MAG TPA: hypothetical protein PKD59_00355 [Miltoncostaeaceae bacterium]|nr:hypothetical protein [Miltoncostaeaceae bacterium]
MPPDHAAELLRLARLYVSEDDAERLVGWLAWRTGHDPAAVRGLPVVEQLERALRDWLDDQQRAQLLRWLAGRLPLGLSPVPG